jgi:phosphatidylglycerophosphatase A
VSDALGEEDPQAVVIDEVAGTLLAMGIARPAGIIGELAAFALFRVLDITKPGVIDRAQRLRPEGLGIMADDVLAGLGAGVAIRVAARWLW